MDSRFCEDCGFKLFATPPATPVVQPPTPPPVPPPIQPAGQPTPPPVVQIVQPPVQPVVHVVTPSVDKTIPQTQQQQLPFCSLSFSGNTVMVTEFPRVFGRADFKSFVTDSRFISRQHFTIFREGYEFYIRDGHEGQRRWLNSTNGTMLNGVDISGAARRELKDGDRISVGETFAITFHVRT